jgi:predicted DNA-binding protein (UPF0251 family)
VEGRPIASVFKPAGIPARELAEIVMTLDEFEAVRLADLEGMYQEQAAAKMGVSRPTFSRIADAAHRKIADAIVNGKALKIEGGPVHERPRCGTARDAMTGAEPSGRCGPRRRSGCGRQFRGEAPNKGESK